MKRRAFLTSSAVSLSAIAGCLGGGGGGNELNCDATRTTSASLSDERDGYPPAFDQTPDERTIDTSSFGTVAENGVDVPLAPIDVAYYWYKRGEARIADARGQKSYNESHIYGAVLSQAYEQRRSSDDPVKEWPKCDRIVCYCGCPHHLSSIRASQLINQGYQNVYVIDEGFWKWHDKGYPMAGSNVEGTPEKWVIRGEAQTAFAGKNAWARHRQSRQVESTDITDDGSYELHLKFHEVGPDSTIEVETPGYTVEGKLKDLASGTIRG